MSLPRLKYLRKANTCNYCQDTRGFTHSAFGERERRLHRVECGGVRPGPGTSIVPCDRKHLVCFGCANGIGSVFRDGRRKIKTCAKRYFWKNIRPRLAANGGKGD